MKATLKEKEIACQQVLSEDGSVFSIQWMDIPMAYAPPLTPLLLWDKYLAHISRFTFSLIRPTREERRVEFRLFTTGLSLLTFREPVPRRDVTGEWLTLDICGGLLVQRQAPPKGELAFQCSAVTGGMKLTLQLSGYAPLLLGSRNPSVLRKWLYRLTQAHLHKIATIRFLARLYQELSGEAVRIRVARVKVKAGEET